MFQVLDIFDEAKTIAGFCDQVKLFRWISDALQLIANKGTFDPYMGYVDLCVSDGQRLITLPREVETPLAVNIGGRPALGRDQLFSFHQNGPGDCITPCKWTWDDKGFYCTYRDLPTPARLVARLQRQEDANSQLVVYGEDANGRSIRQQVNGVWQDGWRVPTVWGYPLPDVDAPRVKRITRIYKAPTAGIIELRTEAGVVLGAYEPDETDPWYRRIMLGRTATWVRVAYRKNNPQIKSLYERIPLRSRIGFLLAMRAVKAYNETDLANAHVFESDAVRLETEAQESADPPTLAPIQVVDMGNNIATKMDFDIQ